MSLTEKLVQSVQHIFGRSDSTGVIELDASNFDELVIDSNRYALILFKRSWCPACRLQVPEMKRVAAHYDGIDFLVGMMDIGPKNNNDIYQRYKEHTGVPAFIFFDQGKPIQHAVQFKSALNLIHIINSYRKSLKDD